MPDGDKQTRHQFRPAAADSSRYAGLVLAVLVLAGLYIASRHNYLLFHTLAEMFSIVVAVGIFAFAWSTRRTLGNNYLLFIGVAYLFVAAFDLLHTLAYTGMGVFPGYGANLPTQLWVSARYIESVSLLAAPLLIRRNVNSSLLFVGYSIVAALLLTSIFGWNVFPEAFAEGTGLTTFKKASEYVISLILLGAAFLLYQRRSLFDRTVFRLLIASIFVTIASELAFTLYTDPFGLANFVGHILKIISFFLIYRAIIVTGLAKPYDLLLGTLREREQALRESAEQYSVVVGNLADAVFWIRGGVVVWCNDSVESIYGYTKEELTGREATFFYPDNISPAGFVEQASRSIREHGVFLSTSRFQRKSGDWADIEYSVSQLQDRDPPEVIAVARDVTERRRAQEAMQESEEKYRTLVERANDGIVILQDSIIRYVNPVAAEGMGCDAEELVGTSMADYTHPDDLAEAIARHERRMAGEEVASRFESRIVRPDGTTTDVEINAAMTTYEGRPAALLIMRDVTERKRAEEAVQESEEKYHAIFNEARDGIALINAETGQIHDCNPEFERQTGRKLEQLRGMKIWEIRPAEKMEAAEQKFFAVRAEGAGDSVELEFEKPDGETIPVEFRTKAVIIQGRRYLQSIVRDITEQRRAEEALRDSEERFRSVVETAGDAVISADANGITVYWNRAAEEAFGYKAEEMIGQPITMIIPERLRSRHIEGVERVNTTGETRIIDKTVEMAGLRKDGTEFPIELSLATWKSKGNTFFTAILSDITERKKLDELKDEFIGLVSHELRSPLTVVIGAVNTALTEMERLSPEDTRQLLEDAAAEADVLSHLLGNLLELSRFQADRLVLYVEPLNVNTVVQGVIEKVRQQHPGPEFRADVPRGLPQLHADQLRIERILYNLLENAAKYSPPGGEICVSVKRDRRRLIVGVSDQGIGIAVEHQAMLFRPFQRIEDSMSARVKGIGLGLLVCRRLVEAHGGRVWLESEPGKGSTFFFSLPLVQPES